MGSCIPSRHSGFYHVRARSSSHSAAAPPTAGLNMPIFSFLLQGRCKLEDKCLNEHPRDGHHHGHNQCQGSAATSSWNPSGQRYVEPSSFTNNLTWTKRCRYNDGDPFGAGSGGCRNRNSKSNAPSGFYTPQSRFGALANQDHGRDSDQDEESPIDDIQGTEMWEASGQWPLSVNCVQTKQRPLPGFTDISCEELSVEGYTSHQKGHLQNYGSSGPRLVTQCSQRIHGIRNWTPSSIFALGSLVQQLVTQWIHGIRNWTPSSIFALFYQLIWPPTVTAQSSFGGLEQSDFGTSSTSADQMESEASVSFKVDSPSDTPNSTDSFSFSSAPALASIDSNSMGFGTIGTQSASAFSFALTTTTSGATASTFSDFRSVLSAPTIATPGFGSSMSSGFGGTTVISGFGTNTGAGATFAGTTTAFDFGELSHSTKTSTFGSVTTGASSHSTTGTCLFGKDVTVSNAANMVVSSAVNAMLSNALFTPRNELSQENLHFEFKKYTLAKVPLVPPSTDLLSIK